MPRVATKKATAKPAAKLAAVPSENHENPEPIDPDSWFADVDDIVDYINALFWGREGSGKTTALARMSTLGRTLIINAEGGVKIKPLLDRGAVRENLKIFPPPSSKIKITHRSLDNLYRRVKADLERDPNSWVCIGFDSATEVYQAVLDDVQKKRVQRIREKGGEPDEYFVDISDYGTMSKMVRDLLRKFRDLNCHVVFTALERRDVDQDTKKPQYGPSITPGLQADLLGYPDLVLMFKAADEDGPFRALTQATSRFRAKDRFGVLPKVLAEPMGDRIVQYVHGDLTPDTDPFQADLPAKVKKSLDRNPATSDEDEDEEEDDD
jgi:hypothetical protein